MVISGRWQTGVAWPVGPDLLAARFYHPALRKVLALRADQKLKVVVNEAAREYAIA